SNASPSTDISTLSLHDALPIYRNQRDRAGENGPAQRLVDAFIHDLFDRAFAPTGQAFANSIVNNDGVVNGVAGDSENGANHGERSEEHTSELQSLRHLVCRLLL